MKLNGGEREGKGAVGATVIARKIPKFGGTAQFCTQPKTEKPLYRI